VNINMKAAENKFETAVGHLRKADPVMRRIIDAVGPFTLRPRRDRFRMLVRSIVSQQISTAAARSILQRLEQLAAPEGLTAPSLARFTADELRAVGVSPQKAAYLLDLVRHVNEGALELRTIGRLSDEQVIEQLIQVKGIGRWTAQMFLIFSLGRLDVFPHDDLGVRSAIRRNYGLSDLSDKATSHAIAQHWRPYASVASWYCWRSLELPREETASRSKQPKPGTVSG
jgi:DNA-3-methyladenine glycosylase II